MATSRALASVYSFLSRAVNGRSQRLQTRTPVVWVPAALAWPVTVTSVWQVTWTGVEGGVPVLGTQDVALTVDRALPVGELQVLVTGGGR